MCPPQPRHLSRAPWGEKQGSRPMWPHSGRFLHLLGAGVAGADRAVCVQIVKELLSCGADPNMLLTKGLGSALCVACDIIYESQRSLESRLALVSRG